MTPKQIAALLGVLAGLKDFEASGESESVYFARLALEEVLKPYQVAA